MIGSLVITIVIEGAIVLAYAFWKRKPAGRILLASLLANILTQSMLWVVLNLFFDHYRIALLTSEVCIVWIEGAFLRLFPDTRLTWKESIVLSLAMNVSSFSIGWFLPV